MLSTIFHGIRFTSKPQNSSIIQIPRCWIVNQHTQSQRSVVCLSWTIVRSYECPKFRRAWASHQSMSTPRQFFTASQLCSFDAFLNVPELFWCIPEGPLFRQHKKKNGAVSMQNLSDPAPVWGLVRLWLQKARTSSMECKKRKAQGTWWSIPHAASFALAGTVIPSCWQCKLPAFVLCYCVPMSQASACYNWLYSLILLLLFSTLLFGLELRKFLSITHKGLAMIQKVGH